MHRIVLVVALAAVLSACGQAEMQSSPSMAVTEEAAAPAMDAFSGEAADMAQSRAQGAANSAPPAEAPAPQPGQAQQPAGPAPVLYLAYSYAVGLEIPSQRLSSVMDHHVQACQQAGPRLCQLIGSNRSGDPESYLEGYVSLRGEPVWLRTFMGGLSAEAAEAGGRVIAQSTNTEDLTRSIVDTEARLRALTSLRDRLEQLLRSRPGRLSDLLEVERELARVQGELDATQSNLAVMRTRVSMSELTLSYRSAPRPVGSDTFRPLRDALAGFLGVVVGGFATIIYLIAGLLPFVIVIVPVVWGLLRWRKARGGRFFRRAPRPSAPPTPPAAA